MKYAEPHGPHGKITALMQRPINRIEWGPLGPPLIQGLQRQVNKHPFSKTSTRKNKQTSASTQAPEEQAVFEKRWVLIQNIKFQLSYDN